MADCLNVKDGELQHFGGRQCSVVRTRLHAGLEQHGDVWFVWENVGDRHWVCGDVWDLECGHGLVEEVNGVEKENGVDVVRECVVVEPGNADGGSDDESAAEIEIVIVVRVEGSGVECRWDCE